MINFTSNVVLLPCLSLLKPLVIALEDIAPALKRTGRQGLKLSRIIPAQSKFKKAPLVSPVHLAVVVTVGMAVGAISFSLKLLS